MKEIRLFFNLRIALKQTDVHWVEEELLRLREEVFLEVLGRVLRRIPFGRSLRWTLRRNSMM